MIEDWGRWKIAWVNDDAPETAVAALRDGRVDGLGISPLKGFRGKDLTFLREIALDNTGLVFPHAEYYDLRFLHTFNQLRFLRVLNNKQSLDFSCMTRLEDLGLEWQSKCRLPESNHLLKRLFLRLYKTPRGNLEEFPSYPALDKLEFVLGNVRSLDGIEKLGALNNGEFAYMKKLESVGALSHTPVRTVRFETCKKIKDMLALAKCPELTELILFKCANLESLDFINAFSKLEEFRFVCTRVLDGNMLPLLKLRRVAFMDNRKYSHTENEIKNRIRQPIVPMDLTKEGTSDE